MAHAEHFLSRLNRLDVEQEQLALALYRDAELVRRIVKEAQVPEGSSRVAFAIAAGDRAPHILVERDGTFVTCLGAGMSVRDAAVVPHLRFLELRQHVFALREIYDRAYAVLDTRGRDLGVARKLIEGGSSVASEDMQTALALAPLWGPSVANGLAGLAQDFVALREELLARSRIERWARTADGEESLRRLWQMIWAISHFSIVATAIDPNRAVEAEVLAMVFVPLYYEALKSTFVPALVRLYWVVGKVGAAAMDLLERDAAKDGPGTTEIFNGLAFAAMGNDAVLRERGLRYFATRARGDDPDMVKSLAAIGRTLTEPEAMEAEMLSLGRSHLWTSEAGTRWSSREHIPEGLARAAICNDEISMFGDDNLGLARLVNTVPWLSRARAEELYFPASEAPSYDLFDLDKGLALLQGFRHLRPAPAPIRVEPTLGRNEPCACGSGKKFKKCCAR